MDVLRGTATAVLGAAGTVTAVLLSCEVAIPPGQFFNAQGITSIASYPTSAPPRLLTGAGDYLVYSEGKTLFRLAKADGSSPYALPMMLDGEPTAMAFDGAHSVVFCTAGTVGAFDSVTLEPVPLPSGLPPGCLVLALTTRRLAYISAPDGGTPTLVTTPLGDAGSERLEALPLLDGGAEDPSETTVCIVGNTAYFGSHAGLFAARTEDAGASSGRGGGLGHGLTRTPCRVADIGYPPAPKVVVFDGGTTAGARASIILRTQNNDSLRRFEFVDPDHPACCAALSPACAHEQLTEQAPAGAGDFTVAGGLFYWSNSGEIKRANTASVTPEAGTSDAAPFVDIPGGAPIPNIVVDAQNIYFVLGSAIFRAPLPPAP